MIFPTAGVRCKWQSWRHLVVNNDGIIEVAIIVVITIVADISFSVNIVIHTLSRPNSMLPVGIERLMATWNRRRGLGSALVGPLTCFKDQEIERIFARVGEQPGANISIIIQEDELGQR